MRLRFLDKATAQAKADAIHAWMIANNADYAQSVAAGQTTAWAKPYQDLDEQGVPLNTNWYINLKERAVSALDSSDRTKLEAYRRSV